MNARYMIERPQDIEATMKITMTVKEWEELREQLEQKWPAARLSMAITNLLVEARRTIYAPEHDAFNP